MSIHIHILSNSKEIRPYAKKLRSTTRAVAVLMKKLLPLKDIDIVFYDNPVGTIDEIGGVGGFTPTANIVFISLNPRHTKFEQAIEKELPYQLAHEFHHAVRFRTPIKKETLFEAIISEGLADYFAMEVTGKKQLQPWSRGLTAQQNKFYLRRASKEWNKSSYDHNAWFYGSKSKSIPRWTGYTLGYNLVKEYMQKHQSASASKLVSADAILFYSGGK